MWARVFRPRVRWLIAGGALCGLTAGIRVQTVMLTAPLLLAVLVWPRTGLSIRARLLALVAALAGVLVWAIPLLAANGGLEGYLTALGSQAGEDFSGVVMLWTTRQAKVAALAILNSFVWPWEQYRFGVAMLVLAAVGAARLGWRDWRALVLCAIAFAPYAIFHLLFHETATMRYALPLIVPVALLAATAIDALGRQGAHLCRRDGCCRVAGDDGAGGAGVRAGRQPGVPCVRRAAARHSSPASAGCPRAGFGCHVRDSRARDARLAAARRGMAARPPRHAGSPCRSWPRVARAGRALAGGARRARALCRRPAAHRSRRCSIRMRGRSWHPSAGPFRSGHSSPASGQEMPTPTQCGRQAGCSTKGGH